MQRHFDTDYMELKTLLAEMSTTASGMVENAIKALVNRDSALAREVIATDSVVDALDLKVDAVCLKLLALYEPKAIDLRSITTALRIIVDIERVGDHCTKVCEEVLFLNEHPQLKPYIDLPIMAEKASCMVHEAVEAFFDKDVKKALSVIRQDDVIDGYMNQISRELFTYMVEDITKARLAFSLMNITRRIERIADHATNIAEQTYFMVKGTVIRHSPVQGEDGE